MRTVRFSSIIAGILALASVTAASPALSQMSPEEEQRCVWQCLANSPGGAASKAYQQCVDRMCVSPQVAPPPATKPAPAKWTSGSGKAKGSGFAGIESGGKSFTFVCRRGGPGLFAVAGVSGPADAVAVRIDNQVYGLPFVTQNGLIYTNATQHLLQALMNGRVIQVSNARSGVTATFPLSGSGSAIRKALAICQM